MDQKVMVKSRRPGPANWIPGRIVQRFGPLVYEVNVGKDQTWRCHIDQLKEAMEVSTPESNFDPSSQSEQASAEESTATQEQPADSGNASPSDDSSEEEASESDSSESSESEVEASAGNVPSPTGHRYPLRDRAKHQRFKL